MSDALSVPPEGVALAMVGSAALLLSTTASWFDVIVEYPTDQVRRHYGVSGLGFGRESLVHNYIGWGRAFGVLTVLAGLGALLAVMYGSLVVRRMPAAAKVIIACGAVAVAVVLGAWLTFELADPKGIAMGGEVRLDPGGLVAVVASPGVLAGGLLLRRGT